MLLRDYIGEIHPEIIWSNIKSDKNYCFGDNYYDHFLQSQSFPHLKSIHWIFSFIQYSIKCFHMKITSKLVDIYIYFSIDDVHHPLTRNLSIHILVIYNIREPNINNMLQSNCSHAHIRMTHRSKTSKLDLVFRKTKTHQSSSSSLG